MRPTCALLIGHSLSPPPSLPLLLAPPDFPAELDDVDGIPDALRCPISHMLMREPTLATTTGRTYERAMIVRWLETHGSDPTDPSSVLNIKDLVPNRAVRAMIEEFARTAEM